MVQQPSRQLSRLGSIELSAPPRHRHAHLLLVARPSPSPAVLHHGAVDAITCWRSEREDVRSCGAQDCTACWDVQGQLRVEIFPEEHGSGNVSFSIPLHYTITSPEVLLRITRYPFHYLSAFLPRASWTNPILQAIYISGTALLRESANAPAGAVKKRATALDGVSTCIRALNTAGETWPCAIRWAEELAKARP
jgi:hypothetical protein